nr:hypothetical protein [Tanacetum cinerariifolium]
MSLLQEAMDACATLTRRVEHLEYDKVAQALEITTLKRRVKKLEKRNKGRMIAEMDQGDDVVLKDDKEEDKEVVDVVKDVEEAKENETEPTKVQKVVDVVTTAKLITEVVIATSAIVTATEAQVPAATLTVAPARIAAAPSRRRKGVDIDWDEAIDHVKRKAKEDPAIKIYQVLKRKPQTEAQARKNMIMYLKNVAGFKMDYFKGMSYDDICPIFKAKFNSSVDFLLKTKEQIEEKKTEHSKHLMRLQQRKQLRGEN